MLFVLPKGEFGFFLVVFNFSVYQYEVPQKVGHQTFGMQFSMAHGCF